MVLRAWHTSKRHLVGADQRIRPQPNHETKGKDALTNIYIDGMRYAQKFHKIILKIFQNKLMPSTFCFILNQILRAFPAVGGIFIDESPTLTQNREFLIFVATMPHLP